MRRDDSFDDGLPETGYVRLRDIIRPHGPLPISRSQFWELVKSTQMTPVTISPRVTCFFVDKVRKKLCTRSPISEAAHTPTFHQHKESQNE